MHKNSGEKLSLNILPERPNREANQRLIISGGSKKDWGPDADWGTILEQEGVLQSDLLINAFKRARRRDFLRPRRAMYAGYNRSLPIGYDSRNSMPSLVAVMLEQLKLRRSQRVLDVGAGSAWTTAIMADVAGSVVGTEVVSELAAFGNSNLDRFKRSYDTADGLPPEAYVEHTPSTLGYPVQGPYDRILVSARLREDWIEELLNQLNPEGGLMVAPVCSVENFNIGEFTQYLVVFTRNGSDVEGKAVMDELGFVPIIRSQSRP